jgi:hypothetical protein
VCVWRGGRWLNGNNEAVCDVDSDQALRTCVQRAFASAAPGSRSCVMRLNVVCASPNADCRPAAQVRFESRESRERRERGEV